MTKGRVVIQNGLFEGQEFEIVGKLTVGRSPNNLIRLSDNLVSRSHAEIERQGQIFVLRDLRSSNGTKVNGLPVTEKVLSNDDMISIGETQFKFFLDLPSNEGSSMGRTMVAFDKELAAESIVELSASSGIFFAATLEGADIHTLQEMGKNFQRLYEANKIIANELELNKVFERVLDQIFHIFPADRALIMVKENSGQELIPKAVRAKDAQINISEITISHTIVDRVTREAVGLVTSDAVLDERLQMGQSIMAGEIRSAMCAPLVHQGAVLGIIYMDTKSLKDAFDEMDLRLLTGIAGPAAIAIRNARLVDQVLKANKELEKSYVETITTLANSVEAKDHYTIGHTWRVTRFALAAAEQLGWPQEKLAHVDMGGVLHDIGKIGVPDAVLNKPAGLTDEEYALMKLHPEVGARIIKDVERLKPVIPYVLCHHERYDGRGYPIKLKGDEVPIEGRLMAVADTFDAMTSTRPYRKGLDPEVAVSEIKKNRGTQFDPEIADAFISVWEAGRVNNILQDYEKSSTSLCCPFCSTFIRVPPEAEMGSIMACPVCRKKVRINKSDTKLTGELV